MKNERAGLSGPRSGNGLLILDAVDQSLSLFESLAFNRVEVSEWSSNIVALYLINPAGVIMPRAK